MITSLFPFNSKVRSSITSSLSWLYKGKYTVVRSLTGGLTVVFVSVVGEVFSAFGAVTSSALASFSPRLPITKHRSNVPKNIRKVLIFFCM